MKADDKAKRIRRFTLYGAAICALAVLFFYLSIFFVRKMDDIANNIYEHPYTVSNEARAMQSRLLDMKIFVQMILLDEEMPSEDFFAERYSLQEESMRLIGERYLGPREDLRQLDESFEKLREIQKEAILYEASHSVEETRLYIEEYVIPRYDSVDECLSDIISFADRKIRNLEKEVSSTARQAIYVFITVLTLIIGMFLFSWKLENKNMRETEYREMLFNRLSTIIDDVFYIYNLKKRDTEFISANQERILGFKLCGESADLSACKKYLPEEERIKLKGLMEEGVIKETKELDFKVIKEDGLYQMKLRVYPEIEKDKVTRYIISISDQTKELEASQNLKDALLSAQRANAAKSEFLSRMSHEIRTPMNAIIGMTTIAAAYPDDRGKVENCLNKISFSSKHLMTLINDVLDMSKIEEGKLSIAHESFYLSQLIESVSTIVYPQAEARGISFKVPLLGVTEEHLIGDTLRMRQILLNLLSNSLKFTPKGGKIFLEVRQLKNVDGKVRFRFTVTDTGIGMSEEFMSRIFKPFEQEEAAIAQKFGGTGLGLSITQNLVSLMGGTIHVESRQNEGTSFLVEMDFESLTDSGRRERRPQEFERLKVLVADDDADTCTHTTLLLDKIGIHAEWVLNGTEAVSKAFEAHESGNDYDVCFIDWKMPDIDGIETTRRIRRFVGPDTLIIIITAYDWESIEGEAREAGADYFLTKPLFASTLYNTMMSIVRPERTEEPEPIPALSRELAGLRVILAEDNDLNGEIAVEILKMMGVEADCVKNGREALDRFLASGKGYYGAILMDIQMPVMNGYEAAREIRRCGHPDAAVIPILAMTANAFQEDVANALAAGMNGHIAKPIDIDSLYRALVREAGVKNGM